MKKVLSAILLLFFVALPLRAQLRLSVHNGEKIADAIELARKAYEQNKQTTVISIEPGTYREELTIDVPGLTLRNASEKPSIAMRNAGVDIDPEAVRITWYYGHGYQYGSMGSRFNYGGKRERRWNASVLVTAPGFTAENIIFENSFNMYVCDLEVADTILDIGRAEELCGQNLTSYWSKTERPKRIMPVRPKVVGSTEVQQRFYRERASALSFTSTAIGCVLRNCRVVGRQDALYGDHGAQVTVYGGALCGAVDYIFGGMTLTVKKAELVAMVSLEKGDKCYISAGRGARRATIEACRKHPAKSPVSQTALDSIPKEEIVSAGMLFSRCRVRFATADELLNPGTEPVWLGRPWRWWGETRFVHTKAAKGVLNAERWNLGLTKGHPSPWCSAK